jgi:hypothetical protein
VKNDASVRDDDTEKTTIAVKKLQSIELKNCPQNGNGETEQTMATRRSKKAFFVLLCLVTKRSRQETSGPIGDTIVNGTLRPRPRALEESNFGLLTRTANN